MTYHRYKKIYPLILVGVTFLSIMAYLLLPEGQKQPGFIAGLLWFLLAACSSPFFLSQFPIFSDLEQETKERRQRILGGAVTLYQLLPPEAQKHIQETALYKLGYFDRQANIAQAKANIRNIEIPIQEKEIALQKSIQEVRKAFYENDIVEFRKAMLHRIMLEFNFENITYQQMWLLIRMIEPTAEPHLDMMFKKDQMEQELEKMRVETEKLKHSARREKAQADLDEYNVHEDIRQSEDRKRRKGRS